jgi:hypothetical protein
LAATALLSAVAFGLPPVASAEPEWDIGAYDDCITQQGQTPRSCCASSGGEWAGTTVFFPRVKETGSCQAPPPAAALPGSTPTLSPGVSGPRAPGSDSIG